MAKRVIKFWDKIIISLLVILGVFSSCNRNNTNAPLIHDDHDEISNSEADTIKQVISDTTKVSIYDTFVSITMYGIRTDRFETIIVPDYGMPVSDFEELEELEETKELEEK